HPPHADPRRPVRPDRRCRADPAAVPDRSAAVPDPARVAALRADPDLAALHRSLEASYTDPGRAAATDALYARFLAPGDLAFDVGPHVGDRTASFRRLAARAVAVAPQPLFQRALRPPDGDGPRPLFAAAACGRAPGPVRLH